MCFGIEHHPSDARRLGARLGPLELHVQQSRPHALQNLTHVPGRGNPQLAAPSVRNGDAVKLPLVPTSGAVFERGGLLARARGSSRRCLILGVGVLDRMSLPALRAVLGHEYGHLINRDCAGGGLALMVRRHLGGMAMGLAEGGVATWYNPAWWFVNAYFRVFMRISEGASRLQEVMADRWAVSAYGSRSFIDGLTHVIRRSVRLDAQARAAMQVSSMTRAPVTNVYAFAGPGVPSQDEVEQSLRTHLDRPGSPYDSHPRLADRFRFAEAMAIPDAVDPLPGADAWSLLDDRAAMEKRMSAAIIAQAACA